MMMTMISPNSHYRQKEGVQGDREEETGNKKKGRTDRDSDVRCGCSHKSLTVKDVECEEQEEAWAVVWVPFYKKSRENWGLVLFSHDRIGGSYSIN